MADRERMERFRLPARGRSGAAMRVAMVAAAGAALAAVTYFVGGGLGSDRTPTEPGRARAFVYDFPDAHDEPPPGWTGPVFSLSQSYPAELPELGAVPWLAFDFRTQPNEYLRAVLDYALEGNVEVDFRGQDNAVRKWFHAPWLHAGERGREFIHGLTHERTSRPRELAPTQTEPVQNWAVGMYNPRGGYVLGEVWANRDNPDPTKAKFPDGSVAFKLIFTAASVEQVPFLKNSLEWQADIDRASGNASRPTLRLLQIDVAVRDSRADSTTGWVFGTFVYNGDAPAETVWKRVVPVGAMWGNDPDRLADPGPLQETLINPDARALVQHLGYEGRLNGPVDNPRSSCLSCHSTAEIPRDVSTPPTPSVPPANAGPDVIARYFRNIRAQSPFTEGALSVDYSLQLQNGIANWVRETGMLYPAPADAFGLQPRVLRRSGDVRIEPVTRD